MEEKHRGVVRSMTVGAAGGSSSRRGKPVGSCLPCDQQAWRSGMACSTALHAWNLRRFPLPSAKSPRVLPRSGNRTVTTYNTRDLLSTTLRRFSLPLFLVMLEAALSRFGYATERSAAQLAPANSIRLFLHPLSVLSLRLSLPRILLLSFDLSRPRDHPLSAHFVVSFRRFTFSLFLVGLSPPFCLSRFFSQTSQRRMETVVTVKPGESFARLPTPTLPLLFSIVFPSSSSRSQFSLCLVQLRLSLSRYTYLLSLLLSLFRLLFLTRFSFFFFFISEYLSTHQDTAVAFSLLLICLYSQRSLFILVALHSPFLFFCSSRSLPYLFRRRWRIPAARGPPTNWHRSR